MKTYYVDNLGSDSHTESQAQSALTPWRTIQHAIYTCDNTQVADASGVSCYIKIANGETIYINSGSPPTNFISFDRLNPSGTVVIQPATNPGPYQVGFTMAGGDLVNTSFFWHLYGDGSNFRFENANFVPAATVYLYEFGDHALSGMEFRDCTFNNSSGAVIGEWEGTNLVSNFILNRCTFNDIYYHAGNTTLNINYENSGSYLNNLQILNCSGNFSGGGLQIAGTNNVMHISGNSFICSSPTTAMTIGTGGNNLVPRSTNVLVENNYFQDNGGGHCVCLDADGAIFRNNTIVGGSVTAGGFSFVGKWGFGYSIYGNIAYALGPSSVCYDIKGITEATFENNIAFAGPLLSDGFNFYDNNDGPTYGRALHCRNIACRKNRIYTTGSGIGMTVGAADASGYMLFDGNDFHLSGTGKSQILTTQVSSDTAANIRAAWQNDSTSISLGYNENESTSGITLGDALTNINNISNQFTFTSGDVNAYVTSISGADLDPITSGINTIETLLSALKLQIQGRNPKAY
jgi:hypothetical protein